MILILFLRSLHLFLSKSFPSSDGLFSIHYTFEDTFKQRWFFLQIDHEETVILNMKPETIDDYRVVF